ncbi:VWA domain-containing protein [Planomicrobium chinense]|uniref:vWA domain-containing protein n=1 Tax=Planococcus chinensis TaxID=272917 RepID=UPI001CC3686B|nr:VWA domain-containing protein [Planococcus chinensis]MBZ5201587.1 VWA domain-containing protein [Planococcus chinensis]
MGLFDKFLKKPEKTADLSGISLKKKTATIVLEKKKLTGVSARVGIVLDISGSMRKLYNEGVVQDVVERVLAVASQFDDDGELDVWVYDNEFSRLPAATEATFMGYVEKNILSNSGVHKFGRNDEPKVMEDVIRKYTKQDPSGEPVFLVFINDGGCKPGIKKFIVESSNQPIFWQFVGIGDSNFDVLRRLDTMEGRVVDNANFFHLDDISQVSDAELYDQLLNEFPMWLKEAKGKGILK